MKVHSEKTTELFKLTVKLSDDMMKMFIDVEPVGKKTIHREHILELIEEFIPRDFINTGVIDDIVKHASLGEAVIERRIAKGREAQPGTEGKLLLLVKKFTGEGHVEVDSRGYAHYSDLHLFDNITSGQVVGRIYPPKPGVDGIDVLQNIVKAEAGNAAAISFDKSLELRPSPDSQDTFEQLVAQNDGLLTEDQGKLCVKEELQVKGDLDFHFGSIDFIGKVNISGDVHQGFLVKARKGIVVDIHVKGAIIGSNKTRIVCSGEVKCKRIQEAEIECHGNIVVEKEAIDCKFRCGASLMVLDRLMGGESFVVCGAESKFFGNEALKQTFLHLCSEIETTAEYSRLLIGIASHDKAIQMVELHLGPYALNPERIEVLRDPHKDKMKRLFAKFKEIQKSRISLLAHKKKMLEGAISNESLRVNILGMLYPGVEIIAGEHKFSVPEELAGPKSIDYSVETGEFTVGDLQGLQCAPVKSSVKEGVDEEGKESGAKDAQTPLAPSPTSEVKPRKPSKVSKGEKNDKRT